MKLIVVSVITFVLLYIAKNRKTRPFYDNNISFSSDDELEEYIQNEIVISFLNKFKG